ncbi:MAG TPA: hypothetical protein PKI61_01440 [bacterium]|nr:hypothetical protein [bacterium]HPT29550.1 hypothetical protein [bacterium]
MERKSNFSVNLDLTDEELLDLKKIILGFIAEKAESKVISYYRPEAKEVIFGGLKLNGGFSVGDPSQEQLNKVLDVVKSVEKRNSEEKIKNVITISLPLFSTPTGKAD